MKRPLVAVYAGTGSSHSWTWLARLFDATGLANARFLGTDEFVRMLSEGCDSAIISGGDGHSIAGALDGKGFSELAEFIRGGGLYVGICAGAYLPLPSSIRPFRQFNLSSTKIDNIGDRSSCADRVSTRTAVPYGSCSVVHPVRGEVVLSWDGRALTAPLYGGPVFREPTEDRVVLRYSGFSDRTEFQAGAEEARSMVLGKPACVTSRQSAGSLLLIGPHLEHPGYPEANALFIRLAGLSGGTFRASRLAKAKLGEGLRKAVADLKVAVLGLENRSFIVGRKLWDGSRLLELAAAVETYGGSLDGEQEPGITATLENFTDELRRVVDWAALDGDADPGLLVECARACTDSHFRAKAESR